MALTAIAITGCGGGDGGSDSGSGENGGKPDPEKHVYSIDVTAKGPLARGVPTDSLPVGINTQYQATVTYTDKTVDVMTDGVEWRTSNENATITPSGVLRTEKVGEVIVSATLDSVTGEASLNVMDAEVTALALTPANASIPVGDTQQYAAIASYNNNTSLDVSQTATWSSSATDIASINASGLATAASEGTTTITAKLDGFEEVANLKAYNSGPVVTWGASYGGGDSSAVADKLTNVQSIVASRFAFAAIRN